MTPTTAVLTAVGAILAGVLVALLRNSRSSPETRTALDSGWDKLTGGLERRLASLEESDLRKDEQLAAHSAGAERNAHKIAELELAAAEQAESFRKVRDLNAWLTNRVAQLVAFIVSSGLTPPDEDPRP